MKKATVMMRLGVTLILALLLSACSLTPTYDVKVDAISAQAPFDLGTYRLEPSDGLEKGEDLVFKEFSQYVHQALKNQGFTRAEGDEAAAMTVLLDYGVGKPQVEQRSRAVPLYGRTGFHTVTETTHVTNDDGETKLIQRTTHAPSYGVTGYSNEMYSVTTYESFIELVAVDAVPNKSNKSANHLWQIVVTLQSPDDDLRYLFPIMMGAAQDHIATNTGRKVTVTLEGDDQRVMSVRGIRAE